MQCVENVSLPIVRVYGCVCVCAFCVGSPSGVGTCLNATGRKYQQTHIHQLASYMVSQKDVRPVTFEWSNASDLYELNGGKFVYKAGGADPYRPVVGALPMAPNSGLYFFEYRVNCDNTRVGLCTQDVDVNGAMGAIPNCWSINLQSGAVEVNGVEVKRLWRLVTPVSGGVCGFVFDSANGTLQFYFNEEFQGTAVNEAHAVRGTTVFPCCGVSGVEANNRNIGVGMKGAEVNLAPRPYRTFA